MLSKITTKINSPRTSANKCFYSEMKDKSGLKQRISELIPGKIAEVKEVRSTVGKKLLGTCSIDQAYTGMRGVKCMVWEPSELDVVKGIRFRGYSIEDIRKLLPHKINEPTPEALYWLMLTGEIPTAAQVDALSEDLNSRVNLPPHVVNILGQMAKAGAHPMTQLVSGVSAMQTNSKFVKAYQNSLRKDEYWHHTYEDCLDLVANLPAIASLIYRNTFKNGIPAPKYKPEPDYAANYSRQLGFDDPEFHEMMRLYLTIHADHEGGNVSAHTTRLVGSALADPYLSFTASMCGLAGPLHGLANQEVLRWVQQLQKKTGKDYPSAEDVRKALWDTLNSGQVIPGYGHAVIQGTDPRYLAQRQFALKYLPDDPLFRLVSRIYEVAPGVLTEHGKTRNPWPNVDAHSGCLLVHYGLTEYSYYTVLFGVARAFGVTSSLVWDRILGISIERPKSVTTSWIKKNITSDSPSTPIH